MLFKCQYYSMAIVNFVFHADADFTAWPKNNFKTNK